MIRIYIQKSKPPHKYKAVIYKDDKKIKTVHFGAAGYEDYTTHKDKERMKRYLKRHSGEDWNDYNTAGFWSRWILWNKPSFKKSLDDTSKRFKLWIISDRYNRRTL